MSFWKVRCFFLGESCKDAVSFVHAEIFLELLALIYCFSPGVTFTALLIHDLAGAQYSNPDMLRLCLCRLKHFHKIKNHGFFYKIR